jgi:hypothetical protein
MMIQSTAMSSYYGANPVTIKLTAQNPVFTTVSTGVGSLGLPISFAGVGNGTLRFGTAFDEVRVLSATVRINPLTASNGFTSFFWSEKSLGTLSIAQVTQRTTRDIVNSNGAGGNYVMNWKSDGFQDLSWDPLSAPVPAAYFYAFTDPSFGTPAATTLLFVIQVELTCQFRGIASV